MPLIGIEGDIQAGKTLVMTALVLEEAELMRKPVFANYGLRSVPFTYLTVDMLREYKARRHQFMRACIALDEIQTWLDARLSMSKSNRLLSYFIQQTGKSDINLYYTTQDLRMVDGRLTRLTNYVLRVKPDHSMGSDARGNPYWHTVTSTHVFSGKTRRFRIDARKIWPRYDTREIIEPPDSSLPAAPSGARLVDAFEDPFL